LDEAHGGRCRWRALAPRFNHSAAGRDDHVERVEYSRVTRKSFADRPHRCSAVI
jgi:hypothetical protein